MILPGEDHWKRVEELSPGLEELSAPAAAARLRDLEAQGESATVISLLGCRLSLPPLPPPLGPGSRVGGRYDLLDLLGNGGMGSVWRARQELIGREVALKMIHPALVTPALCGRFTAEMELLGRLEHPGIVRIFDAGIHTENGTAIPFYAMQLSPGQPVHRWAAAHRGDRERLLRVMIGVCAAVQHAHECGVVHRDLKPANILVDATDRAVVLDFGIARLTAGGSSEEPGFSGTPHYAAPEQHLGRDRDFRSGESVDVYAMGALLYEVLTGRRLHDLPAEAPLAEVRRAVLEDRPPRLRDALTDCPADLDEIAARAVRRDPADRYLSIAALVRALIRVADALARPSAAPPPPWRPAAGAIVPGTQWKLTRLLGEGGTGQVWEGQHDQLQERRVFKFCDDPDKARTLSRELTLFRLLKDRIGRNPHFVPLHEVSLDEPPWYLMMDSADAVDLEGWCAAQPGGAAGLSEGRKLEIVAQAAEALQAAHEAGILHRDIKPANLLVRTTGTPAGVHVLVADFGIGQLAASEWQGGATRLGFTRTVSDLRHSTLAGSLRYLAPEAIGGETPTARSDIYSLGVILWQLLTGNLRAALDAADWAASVPDKLLVADLRRCLAGNPDQRWPSAGELAASLRALPDRRAEEARRAAELAARERSAYRRGVMRTAAAAAVVLCGVSGLTWFSWHKYREAERANGEHALGQALALPLVDSQPGRRERGLQYLETAAQTVPDRERLRTAAAGILSLTGLRPAAALPAALPDKPESPGVSAVPGETVRVESPDHSLLAIGRDADGQSGAVEIRDPQTGGLRVTVEREDFPWVPVPEPGLTAFSPAGTLLAVGGGETSQQVLLIRPQDGTLAGYLFQGSEPSVLAWHPDGRMLVTGSRDGTLRIWDTDALSRATDRASAATHFDVPPRLDVPALDAPAASLTGHRSRISRLAISADGRRLVSLDETGYLRLWSAPAAAWLPDPDAITPASGQPDLATLTVEHRISDPREVRALQVDGGRILLERPERTEVWEIQSSALPREIAVSSSLTSLAWSPDGEDLCAIDQADIFWIRPAESRVYHAERGKNAQAVGWAGVDGFWAVTNGQEFAERRVVLQGDHWAQEKYGRTFPLKAATEDRAAITAMATARDGRVALYHGGRIQFYRHGEAAPDTAAVFVPETEGAVLDRMFWDDPGQLLVVAYQVDAARLRVHSWKTSGGFPPEVTALPVAEVDCQSMAPAQDGTHWLGRSERDGLFRYEAGTGLQEILDTSPESRQAGAMAATGTGWLATIIDGCVLRLHALPGGRTLATFPAGRLTGISTLEWDRSGQRLAGTTTDGSVRLWDLGEWNQWLTAHGLQEP